MARAGTVVDVASDPRLSDPDSPYFGPDHVHLDDAGYGIVASLVATALEHPSSSRSSHSDSATLIQDTPHG